MSRASYKTIIYLHVSQAFAQLLADVNLKNKEPSVAIEKIELSFISFENIYQTSTEGSQSHHYM